MDSGKAHLSHIVIFCFDFPKMLDFYTGTLGFSLSDIGKARGNDICFLTLDPEADHHMLALASGRTGPREGGPLNHIAFRVDTLAELRRRHRQLTEAGVNSIEPITHGSWLSVYYRDPENNRLEFFWDTPFYVKQPVVETLNFSLSDEEILRVNAERFEPDPSFKPMTEWKAKAAKAFAEKVE